jgi:hypothetical protein
MNWTMVPANPMAVMGSITTSDWWSGVVKAEIYCAFPIQVARNRSVKDHETVERSRLRARVNEASWLLGFRRNLVANKASKPVNG